MPPPPPTPPCVVWARSTTCREEKSFDRLSEVVSTNSAPPADTVTEAVASPGWRTVGTSVTWFNFTRTSLTVSGLKFDPDGGSTVILKRPACRLVHWYAPQ